MTKIRELPDAALERRIVQGQIVKIVLRRRVLRARIKRLETELEQLGKMEAALEARTFEQEGTTP